jgi:hypothetical protein
MTHRVTGRIAQLATQGNWYAGLEKDSKERSGSLNRRYFDKSSTIVISTEGRNLSSYNTVRGSEWEDPSLRSE